MLSDFLHKLKNTGEDGFEGLIRRLLGELTNFEFRLSRTGSQHGRDARALGTDRGSVMIECKNYLKSTKLDERELTAELDQAIGDDPMLDVWILATSRPIPDQLTLLLSNKASRICVDFLGLDCGDTSPGPLDNLCAAFEKTVLKALSDAKLGSADIAAAQKTMQDIASRPNFNARVDNIRKQLMEPSLGWPAWQADSAKSWLSIVSSDQDSRARFGQYLAILSSTDHLVPRKAASAALDRWWQNWQKQKNPFFMLGEEGDGKTWAVAQWITKHVQSSPANFPPVVFIPSTDAKGNGTVEELVVSRLIREYGERKWLDRLRRWRKSKDGPLAIVVLDGLNERQSHTFWRNVIDTGLATEWKESLALICTLRTGYWSQFFRSLEHLKATRFVVQPYNDSELGEALAGRKQKLADFPQSLHSLLRKPRYLELAMNHRQKLTECGDFTVARLLYEDWIDRYNRKNSCAISSDEFNELLKSLANDFHAGQLEWQPETLANKLALAENRVLAFQELSTGGVLDKTPTGWSVQADRLSLGLGMLLCAQLQHAEKRGENLSESIASWIEPYAGADLQSQSLEFAALHSLMTECSSALRIELLAAWLGTQNPGTYIEDSVIRRFTAYLPDNTDTYFKLAEKVWSAGNDSPWAQEIVLRGLMKWSKDNNEVFKALQLRLEHWLGMVPINGQPAFRRGDKGDENIEEAKKQLANIFSTVTVGETARLEGYSFELIEDDGWLRLSRAALSVISSFEDRTPFLRHIVTAMIADSIFHVPLNYPEKMDLLQWILRSSPKNTANQILSVAETLSKSSMLPCQRASARLFTSVGTESGWSLWQGLDQETLFPTPEWVKQAQANPFESFFAVAQDKIEEYPESAEFKPWAFLQHGRNLVARKTFSPKGDLRTLLAPVFDRFAGHCLWIEGSLTPEEHFLDQYEPVLARYCSSRLCELIRSNFAKISERVTQQPKRNWFQRVMQAVSEFFIPQQQENPAPLPYLRFEINKYELLLTKTERTALLSAWRQKGDMLLSGENDWKYTESVLFQSVLPLWTGPEQLEQLLVRNKTAFDLATFTDSFVSDAELSFDEPSGLEDWKRLVIYLTCTKQPALTSNQFRRCYAITDGDLHASCLRYLYACKAQNDIDWLIQHSDWRWQSSMSFVEQEYGAAILLEYGGGLPLADLLTRMPPTRRGTALVSRSAGTTEFRNYAQWIESTLSQIFAFELPSEFPTIEIECDASFPASPHCVSVIHPEESRGIRYVAPETVWGGGNFSKSPDFELDVKEIDKRWRERYTLLQETTKAGAVAGNHWIANVFYKDGVKEAIAAAPDLVDSWIEYVAGDGDGARTRLFRARAFYQTLCELLFELPARHQDAARLYQLLKAESQLLNVVIPRLTLPHLDLALLAAPSSAQTEQLWLNLITACKCDNDLLDVALLIRASDHRSDARQWFNKLLDKNLQSDVPLLQALAYGLLGFLEENQGATWLGEKIDDDTYWLKEVQKTGQRRHLQEQDARYWFKMFCSQKNLDDAWCAFRLFLACVDRRGWLWINDEKSHHNLTHEKMRFLNLNKLAIEKACKKNEEKLQEIFLNCKVDSNLFPWLRFSA